MRVMDRFPPGALCGGDFYRRSGELAPGERVLDMQRSYDDLPPGYGDLMCLSESTVRDMMTTLGYDTDIGLAAKVRQQRAEIDRLRKVNKQFRTALVAVVDACTQQGIALPGAADVEMEDVG